MRSLVGLGFAAALTFTLSAPALAAVVATLSPTTARPGDVVTLTTLEWVSAGPVYLVSTDDFQAEITKFGGQVCGAPEQHDLGRLTRKSDTGSLSFRLPDVPKGDFYFELQVQKGCWRIGAAGGGGPLVLSVADHTPGSTPPARVTPAAQPPSAAGRASGTLQLLAVVAAGALASALLTTILLVRRSARS